MLNPNPKRNRKRRSLFLIALLGAPVFLAGPVDGANYSRPNEPPVRPAFIPLAISQIRPAGWAKEWALQVKAASDEVQRG